MSALVDTSVWFAAANSRDRHNRRAKALLSNLADPLLSDHILIETWSLLSSRVHRHAAEQFWTRVRDGAAAVEIVTALDLERAWVIGELFPDQNFSIVDRTSFALMERLGINRAASFDDDFAVYRYGRHRDRAFEVLR